MLVFYPEKHQYISIDNIDWISVTKFVSQFKQHFDPKSAAEKASRNKKSKWYKIPPDEIRKIWDKEAERSMTLGTWYHNQRERDLIECSTINYMESELPIYPPLYGEEDCKMARDQKLSDGIYPEHMVFLKTIGLCGQSDKVIVHNGIVDISDYKTNKEIKQTSYKNYEGISQKMAPPLTHLDDCHINHYALQLSLYMYMILKHNPSLKPGRLVLHHIIFEEEDAKDEYGYPVLKMDSAGNPIVKEIVDYEVPYMKAEVMAMLNWLSFNKNKNGKELSK